MPETTQEQTPVTATAEAGKTASTASQAVADPMVTIPASEFQSLMLDRTSRADERRAKDAEIEREHGEKIKATTDKDELARLLKEQKDAHDGKLGEATQRYNELEQDTFRERKAAVVAQALAGRTFISAAAQRQVEKLISESIEVVRGADKKLIVRDVNSKQDAGSTLKAMLDSEDFAHYYPATSTQGGANQQGNRANQQQGEGPKPGSLGAIAAQFKAEQDKYGTFGLRPISGR